jgi:hypothetical protein
MNFCSAERTLRGWLTIAAEIPGRRNDDGSPASFARWQFSLVNVQSASSR